MPALKKTDPPKKMNFDEFMEWYEHQEGRWELHNGVPVRKHDPIKGHSERIEHARLKNKIVRALEMAVAKAKRKCEVLPDGMTVTINDEVSYEPDAQVYCGKPLDKGTLSIPNPVIIVEVLSPSTAYKDIGDKLEDYFKLPSVEHYLILDPKHGHITHHYRENGHIAQKAVHEKQLPLDPPGISLMLEGLFD